MPVSTDSGPEKRKMDAVRSVVLFDLIQLVHAVFYAALCLIPGLYRWMFWLFTALAVYRILRMAGALAALVPRFREIERGEMDDAGKY